MKLQFNGVTIEATTTQENRIVSELPKLTNSGWFKSPVIETQYLIIEETHYLINVYSGKACLWSLEYVNNQELALIIWQQLIELLTIAIKKRKSTKKLVNDLGNILEAISA